MTPDEVERLLAAMRPERLPERVSAHVLGAARERAAQRRDLWRCAVCAVAAALLWSVVLGVSRPATAISDDTTALRAMSRVPSFPGLPPALRQQVQEHTAAPSSAAQPPPVAAHQTPHRFPRYRFEP